MAAVTKYVGGTPATLKSFVSGLEKVAHAAPQVSEGGTPLLKLPKEGDGTWVYGQTDTPVSEGSQWAVVVSTFATGFISWRGGKVEGEVMTSVGEDPFDPSGLPPVQSKAGWEAQVGVAFVGVDSDENSELGLAVIYKQNSRGGVEAIQKLRNAVLAEAKAGKPYVAIVELDSSSYTHPEWGKVIKPNFKIVDWMTIDELHSEYGDDVAGVSLSAKKLPESAQDITPPASRRPAGAAAPTPGSSNGQAATPPASRARRGASQEATLDKGEITDIEPTPQEEAPRRRRSVTDDIREAAAAAPADDEPPFDQDDAPAEPPRRRRRSQE
jgi:hypothetical protein